MDNERTRIPTYADGTLVKEGDAIRYQQAPGGLLPASGEWKYGIASLFPHTPGAIARMNTYNAAQGYIALDPEELVLKGVERAGTKYERIAYYGIYGHIIERVEE